MPDWIGGIRNTFNERIVGFGPDWYQAGGDIYNLDGILYQSLWDIVVNPWPRNPIVVKGVRESDGQVNTTEITDYRTYWSNQK